MAGSDTKSSLEQGHPRRWTILWILCTSLVLVVVSVASLNVAIPPIQEGLDASGTELLWIIDAYTLAFAGLLLPAGAIGDRYGRRGALVAGLIVFGIASLGGTLASDPTQLTVWRAVMGVGAAFIMPATLSIVASVFPPTERGRAIAIWAGFAGAGAVVGLLTSGLLLEVFWWGSTFLVNVPIVVGLLVATLWLVPTSKDEAATPLDPVGAMLSVVGLVALVYGVIEGPEVGWLAAPTLVALGGAALVLTAFVLWELRSPHPMLDPRFFRIPEFSLGSLSLTVAFFGVFGLFFVVTQFFQFVQGLTALEAALRILPYGVVLLVVSPRAAVLAERYGSRLVMTAGLAVAAGSFVMLGMATPDTGYWFTGTALVLAAIGTGLFMPPATNALVASLPPAKAGVGSAVNDTTREVGGAIGIAVVGALVAVGYRGNLDESLLEPLSPAAQELGSDSIGGLVAASADLSPEASSALLDAAGHAFTDGVQLGMLVSAGLLAATALLVALLHPHHKTSPGSSESLLPTNSEGKEVTHV